MTDAVRAQALAAFCFPADGAREAVGTAVLQGLDDRGAGDGAHRRSGVVVFRVNEQLLEPGLVVVPAAVLFAEGVGLTALPGEIKHGGERGLVVVLGLRQPPKGALRRQQLVAQLLLLFPGDVRRHDPFHGLLGPLVALAADAGDTLGQAPLFLCSARGEAPQFVAQLLPQVLQQLAGQRLVSPLSADSRLHPLCRQPWQVTRRPVGVAASAEEVVVAIAASAGTDPEEQPGLAAGAEEAAGQVVLVLPGALTGQPVGGQRYLHRGERLWRHQRRVLALILDAAPGDVTQVVAVAQDGVQLVDRQRPGSPAGSGPLRQAALMEFSANRRSV